MMTTYLMVTDDIMTMEMNMTMFVMVITTGLLQWLQLLKDNYIPDSKTIKSMVQIIPKDSISMTYDSDDEEIMLTRHIPKDNGYE